MTWDNTKSTASDPDNPNSDEQLTASEWNDHVTDGHWPQDELNLSINANGDPVIIDPKNGDQTVMRYDRSKGSWVVDALEAKTVGFISPSSYQSLATLGSSDLFKATVAETVADDEKIILESSPVDGEPGLWLIQNNTDDQAAVYATAEATINVIVNTGPWAKSDTDNNNCFFIDGNNDLVLKNRQGAGKVYSAFGIIVDV